jgi:hypothetical protein
LRDNKLVVNHLFIYWKILLALLVKFVGLRLVIIMLVSSMYRTTLELSWYIFRFLCSIKHFMFSIIHIQMFTESTFLLKELLHKLQEYGCSIYTCKCLFRVFFPLKNFLHTLQRYGYSELCTSNCVRLKDFLHTLYEYGCSPVYTCKWLLRWHDEKPSCTHCKDMDVHCYAHAGV